MHVGVSRRPPGGDARAEGGTTREGEGEGICKCTQKGKREAVIKKTERYIFWKVLRKGSREVPSDKHCVFQKVLFIIIFLQNLVPPGPSSSNPAPSPAPADDKNSEKTHNQLLTNKLHKEYAAALDHEGMHAQRFSSLFKSYKVYLIFILTYM